MSLKRLGALFVAAMFVVAAVPAIAASDATVGDFIIKLAKARNLAATDAFVATNSLRGVGVRVPEDLNASKRLTEGDVTRLSRLVGLNVTTTSPDDAFNSSQVDSFFATFGTEIGFKNGTESGNTAKAAGNGGGTFDPYSRGKGQANGHGKGLFKTPKEPK